MQSNGPTVLLIRRIEFDYLLASLAREAGAEILDAGRDRAGPPGRRRRHAPDARGPRAARAVGHCRRRRQQRRRAAARHEPGLAAGKLALDMMEETPVAALRAAEPDTLSVFYGYGGAHGYAYIFPKREHVNVGIGYVLPYFKARVDLTPYDLQQMFVGELRDRGLMAGESQRAHFTPFLIPIGGPLRKTAEGRVLLAGDAGGFVNGFSAEGIYYAMVTGDLAAGAVLRRRTRPAIAPGARPPGLRSRLAAARSAPSCATRC